jgi:hypothetical protein
MLNHFYPSLCLKVSHPINRLNNISQFHSQSSLLFSSQILCIFFASPTFAHSNLVVTFFVSLLQSYRKKSGGWSPPYEIWCEQSGNRTGFCESPSVFPVNYHCSGAHYWCSLMHRRCDISSFWLHTKNVCKNRLIYQWRKNPGSLWWLNFVGWPLIFVSTSVLDLLHIDLLAHRILTWLLDFWKIFSPCY